MTPLTNARVFVTGGSGLLGSHVCDALLEQGVRELVVLDNFVRGRRHHLEGAAARGEVTIVDGSVTDAALVRSLTDGADFVAHLAALRLTRCEEEPAACFEVMVRGTDTVLAAAAEAKVKKVVYASSVVVYGDPVREPMDEAHPLATENFYGAAKVAGEYFCRAWRRKAGLPYVALRFFNMYGPRMSIEGADTEVLVKWLERLEAGEAPVIHGDGSATIDWVHVRDAARATVLALTRPVDGVTLNVASGTATSLKALAALLAELTGGRAQPRYEPVRQVHAGARRVGDPRAAQDALGFTATIGLREGLQELITWYRQQRAAR
ncbi:MAG: NAD-dependent epimerase/dehydratase family protein [Candidatus Rokubacteria bacterium]|nr:NAD-dependent epimerase/dehydratase family protein [Candidatus Rokubacteria bacterium]